MGKVNSTEQIIENNYLKNLKDADASAVKSEEVYSRKSSFKPIEGLPENEDP